MIFSVLVTHVGSIVGWECVNKSGGSIDSQSHIRSPSWWVFQRSDSLWLISALPPRNAAHVCDMVVFVYKINNDISTVSSCFYIGHLPIDHLFARCQCFSLEFGFIFASDVQRPTDCQPSVDLDNTTAVPSPPLFLPTFIKSKWWQKYIQNWRVGYARISPLKDPYRGCRSFPHSPDSSKRFLRKLFILLHFTLFIPRNVPQSPCGGSHTPPHFCIGSCDFHFEVV